MVSISLCMIVRDEEAVLGRCLDSVRGLMDEMILVDTGSVDRTKEIAAEYTDRVYEFTWIDDFAAARNFAFSKASGEYCMWMDADDVMPPDSRKLFLEMKESLDGTEDMVMMPYETAFDERGNAVFSYYRERIVKNHRGYLFRGAVHEAIPLAGNVIRKAVPIRHQPQKEGISDRNLRIYRKLEREGVPFDCRMLYYYGRELAAHGAYEEAAGRLRQFLACPEGWMEDKIGAARQLAFCCERMGQEEQALQALFGSFAYDMPRAETCCQIGRHFLERGSYRQAAFWYEQALRSEKHVDSGAFVQEKCYGFLPAISLCVCYDRLGERQKAERYNELAGKYKPYSPYYLENQKYFRNCGGW